LTPRDGSTPRESRRCSDVGASAVHVITDDPILGSTLDDALRARGWKTQIGAVTKPEVLTIEIANEQTAARSLAQHLRRASGPVIVVTSSPSLRAFARRRQRLGFVHVFDARGGDALLDAVERIARRS
jgi:hypothetical protein